MTNEENALLDIQYYLGNGCYNGDNSLDFGTLIVAAEAIRKQIQKKPIDVETGEHCGTVKLNGFFYGTYETVFYFTCPSCGQRIMSKYKEHHCLCGQAIDWSEVE